ncbi:hypothetical protein JHK82_012724 [Glycine max]|uniref:Vacuolar iron transporter n=1 Tax=Glycine soja TaxID=3848 RepID=A0A0B2NV25_GLYSO|nr:hypothetical protein JHK85_013081 [Glycine max]KAG5057746.1 hypothetical protein JHK86_012742 [Glycine max]KAG5154755.1 hypothetical protein JHK82_012724 [Glycine max]KHM99123.1 Vacuolar iron transporter like 4 [Glycine soja]
MAFLGTSSNEMPIGHIEILIHSNDIEAKRSQDIAENNIDYSQRAQWLREAVFGAKNGLVLINLLMVGVEALNEDIIIMLLAGFAGLVVGACSMAIEEFVYTQLVRHGVVSMLAAVFVWDYKIRLLVFAVPILALLVFGGVGIVLGKSKTPVRRTYDRDSADWRLDDYGYYFWL